MKSLRLGALVFVGALALNASALAVAQELTEIVGNDYPQLLEKKRTSAPLCEAALESGRWAPACDDYHAAAERVISRKLIALDWCEARIKALKAEGGRGSIPQVCEQVMSGDETEERLDRRIYLLKARMDPAGAARTEDVARQILGNKPAGTP